MLIVADENIPRVRECLDGTGEVRLLHGRKMTRADLAEADALLVRSITPVGRELLDGTSVRFVATATIGTDHLDTGWLDAQGIAWTSAAGCNARSVAEYVVAALLEVSVRHDLSLDGRTLGIVGCGNTGGGVAKLAPALGLNLLRSDPPLERAGAAGPWTALDDLIAESDFVTCHVPMNRTGADSTLHLVDSRQLGRMKPGAFLLNASRGAVVDNAALLDALNEGRIAGAVLDVWEGEPNIMLPLLERADLGTPHIAGYSAEGKYNGTLLVVRALLDHFGLPPRDLPGLPPVGNGAGRPVVEGTTAEATLNAVVRSTWDIREDDKRLRQSFDLPEGERGAYFDRLRKEYPVRREFANHSVDTSGLDERTAGILRALGFACSRG